MTRILPLVTLKKRAEFLAIAKTGQRWVAPFFILQIGDVTNTEAAKVSSLHIGFTATTKIGNAVVRARAKRRLRSLAREVMAVHADEARPYVLVARNITGTASYHEMQENLIKGLKRLKLWRDAPDDLISRV